MTSVEQRFAIDISSWHGKTPDVIVQDTASFALEAGRRAPKRRINTVAISVSEFGKLVKNGSQNPEDIATSRIFRWANENPPAIKIWTKSAHPTTGEIFDGILPFADFNPGTAMVWISPPLEGVYKETRMVIYQTIEVNREKYLLFRALCSEQNTQECFEIVRRLSFFSEQAVGLNGSMEVDQVRASPLSLLIPSNETYTSFFSKFINFSEVWEAIAKADDLKAKKWALGVAEEVVRMNYRQIIRAETLDEQFRIGLITERELARRLGYGLLSGPCGKLYSDLSTTSLINEVLGYNIFSDHQSTHCGKCGKHGKFMEGETCPYSSRGFI